MSATSTTSTSGDDTTTSTPTMVASPRSRGRVVGVIVIIAGIVLTVAGATTWFSVQANLADERITVSSDSPRWAGDAVDGPLTAFQEAAMIEKHYLESTGGKTYAELDREDPKRELAQQASFLRWPPALPWPSLPMSPTFRWPNGSQPRSRPGKS